MSHNIINILIKLFHRKNHFDKYFVKQHQLLFNLRTVLPQLYFH